MNPLPYAASHDGHVTTIFFPASTSDSPQDGVRSPFLWPELFGQWMFRPVRQSHPERPQADDDRIAWYASDAFIASPVELALPREPCFSSSEHSTTVLRPQYRLQV